MKRIKKTAALLVVLALGLAFSIDATAQASGGHRSARAMLKSQEEIKIEKDKIEKEKERIRKLTDNMGDPTADGVTEDDYGRINILGVEYERMPGTRKWWELSRDKFKTYDKIKQEIQPAIDARNSKINEYDREVDASYAREKDLRNQLSALSESNNKSAENFLIQKITAEEATRKELYQKMDAERAAIDQIRSNTSNDPRIKEINQEMDKEEKDAKQRGKWFPHE